MHSYAGEISSENNNDAVKSGWMEMANKEQSLLLNVLSDRITTCVSPLYAYVLFAQFAILIFYTLFITMHSYEFYTRNLNSAEREGHHCAMCTVGCNLKLIDSMPQPFMIFSTTKLRFTVDCRSICGYWHSAQSLFATNSRQSQDYAIKRAIQIVFVFSRHININISPICLQPISIFRVKCAGSLHVIGSSSNFSKKKSIIHFRANAFGLHLLPTACANIRSNGMI